MFPDLVHVPKELMQQICFMSKVYLYVCTPDMLPKEPYLFKSLQFIRGLLCSPLAHLQGPTECLDQSPLRRSEPHPAPSLSPSLPLSPHA